jgi:hypothetical protein
MRAGHTMAEASRRPADPWGLESERKDDQARLGRSRAGSVERVSWRGVVRRGAPVACVAVLVAFAVPATVAASSTRPAVPLRGIKGFQVNTGEKGALYSSLEPLAASTGGEVLLEEKRLGNGSLDQNNETFYTAKAGASTLQAFAPPAPARPQQESVVGSMAIEEYPSKAGYKLLWRDLATGRSGTAAVPKDETWIGASPTGWLLEAPETLGTKLVDYDAATKRSTTLGEFPGLSSSVPGVDGVVLTTTVSAKPRLDYVTYSPVKVDTLIADTTGSSYTCTSVTANAAACLAFDSSTNTYTVERLPFPNGKGTVKFKLSKGLFTAAVATPGATAWLDCGTAKTCTLERQKASGGRPVAIKLPRILGGNNGLLASGDDLVYGSMGNASAAGGVFALADTSTKPTHLISAPQSPLNAAAVSLAAESIAWADSSKPGIGIYTRPIRVSGSGVSYGAPRLLAQSGFVATDASAFGLSLSNAGSEIAFSNFRPQPAAKPVGLDLDDNGKIRQISTDADGSVLGYSPTLGPAVSIAGNFVLFETQALRFSLYNVTTAHACTLPAGNADYTLGNATAGTKMLFVTRDGGVYEHAPSCTPTAASSDMLAAPLTKAGAAVYTVTGLGIAGDDVVWGYDYSATSGGGEVASWMNLTGGGVRNILDPTQVVALVLSTTDIGVTTEADGVTELHAVSLPSGAETILSTDSYDLSVGNGVAAWISLSSSVPFAGKI